MSSRVAEYNNLCEIFPDVVLARRFPHECTEACSEKQTVIMSRYNGTAVQFIYLLHDDGETEIRSVEIDLSKKPDGDAA